MLECSSPNFYVLSDICLRPSRQNLWKKAEKRLRLRGKVGKSNHQTLKNCTGKGKKGSQFHSGGIHLLQLPYKSPFVSSWHLFDKCAHKKGVERILFCIHPKNRWNINRKLLNCWVREVIGCLSKMRNRLLSQGRQLSRIVLNKLLNQVVSL